MKEVKVLIVGGFIFHEYINWINGAKAVESLDEADLVLFAGGEDVDPSMYGEPRNPSTHSNITRDIREKIIFERAKELNKPLLGVCRGSQFMCVMAGGRLVQNQSAQKYLHKITVLKPKYERVAEENVGYADVPVKSLLMTSTHHQAQYPFNLPEAEYRVIGWTDGLSSFHVDGEFNEMNPPKECEIVYYPETKALAIQGHPEKLYHDKLYWKAMKNVEEDSFVKECEKTLLYCNGLVDALLENKL